MLLSLAMPLASFCHRSRLDAISDDTWGKAEEARGGQRVRLRNRTTNDFSTWEELEKAGTVFLEEPTALALQTDAAQLGWGGTLGPDRRPGMDGEVEDFGLWIAEERMKSRTLGELRAVTLVPGRGLGAAIQGHDVRRVGQATY